MLVDRDEIVRALRLNHEPGEETEVRYGYYRKKDGAKRAWGERFTDIEKAADFAVKVSRRSNTYAVWHNLNRIDPAAKIEGQMCDEHIIRRTRFVVDIDAVRPANTNATDVEAQAALDMAVRIHNDDLQPAGFTDPIFELTGNGAQLVYAINEAPESTVVGRILEALAEKYNSPLVKIDTSVSNEGRVVKLPGTPARKAEQQPDRPHRLSRILQAPEKLEVVPTAILEKVAAPEKVLPIREIEPKILEFNLPTWLADNQVKYDSHVKPNGTTIYELDQCPFRPGHHGGACIIDDPAAGISGCCHHPECKDKTWPDFRRKIDPHYRERSRKPTRKTVKDAEYQARRFLETLPPCYLYRGEVWLYDGGIYRRQKIDDLKIAICRSLMRVFGQFAKVMQDENTDALIPSVTESFINNVLRCFRSILPQIPAHREMPCWTDGTPAKVLVVENGILDLTTYKRRAHTPRLFSQFRLPYPFDEKATCPKFDAALKTIFDDPAEIDLLQEQFGCTIIGGNQRRVIWLWQGATHGGKGVLTRILCFLLGKENYASIRAGSFSGQFALWNARGKLLIIVPDVNGKKPLPGAFLESAKIISGGDQVDVDGKNKDAVQEILPAKLLIVTNDILKIEDESAAVFNRFRCLKFTHHFFPAGHKLHEEGRNQNENLENELADELPGILNWALTGLRRVDKQGFTTPKASMELQETLEAEGAPIQTYASERLDKDDKATVFVHDVYVDYHTWCREQEIEEPFKPAHFGIALREAIPTVKRDREKTGERRYFYRGIKLRPVENPVPETHLATPA